MNFFRSLFFAFALPAGLAAADAPPVASPIEQAAAAIRAGEFTHAEDVLGPLTGRGSDNARALYFMAIVRVAQQRCPEGVEYAERATKADPTKIMYWTELGHACAAAIPQLDPLDGDAVAGKMRRAYEKALKIDPKNLPAVLGLEFFYERAPELVGGSRKKAREYAERARQLDPYTGEYELGRLAASENNMEEALAHYTAASKLKPDDSGTATACGWALLKLGRTKEARARFEAVLKRAPDFEPAKMGLAQIPPPAK